jgi:hypothetical protein
VLVFGIGVGPMLKRQTHLPEDDVRARGVDVDRQFSRPRNESELL